MEAEAHEPDRGARRLQGAMLEHAGLAIERAPGLAYALGQFSAEAPRRLEPLIARLGAARIEEVRSTALLQAVGDCAGLTAATYRSAEPEALLMIALDEGIDRLIVASIFGEAVGADGPDGPGSERPRTAIETALIEAFARALGEALEAAFAPVAPIALSFERLLTLSDPFALGRRDGDAAAARFSLGLNGDCSGLLILPQTFLMGLRTEFARDPEAEAAPADRRWSERLEVGVRQTRLPVTAVLEKVQMSLGDVAQFRAGALLPLQCKDFTAIRLECSGRGMFACKLGEADGRYRLEVEGAIGQGREAEP